MEDNKNFVEETTENVEATATEEIVDNQVETIPEKTFTQSELNEIVKGAKARAKAQVRKEYDRKYGNLTNVLRAGTGKESVEEMTNTFADFYEKKGIKINREPDYTAKDIEVLATAEANEVIRLGYDEVVDEVDRLASLGVNNMTAKEKALFKVLAEHRQNTERHNELAKIGVTEDVYNSDEFQNFAKQFISTTPIADIWNIYSKTQPKKDIKPMGSMKNSNSDDSGVKDFYTPEEARRFTRKELDDNPALFAAIEKSMQKWK
jgi:hypothetical protein